METYRKHPNDKTKSTKLEVYVQPGASRNRLTKKTSSGWKMAITALPVKGRANKACADFLARILEVPCAAVHVIRGNTGRRKMVTIDGLSVAQVEDRLETYKDEWA